MVIVPKANESDVKEALQEIGGTTLTIHYVSHMDEVLKLALTSDPMPKSQKKKAAGKPVKKEAPKKVAVKKTAPKKAVAKPKTKRK